MEEKPQISIQNSPVKKLTSKQKLFCLEYLKDRNGTQAAIRAGYTEDCATSTASEILTYPNVQEELDRLIEEQSQRLLITADAVLTEFLSIAKADPREAFDDEGRLLDIKQIPDEVAKCISSIEILEEFDGKGKDRTQIGFTKKIKFWDKVKALESLAKHLKLLTVKHELSGPGGVPLAPPQIIFEGSKNEQ